MFSKTQKETWGINSKIEYFNKQFSGEKIDSYKSRKLVTSKFYLRNQWKKKHFFYDTH